MFKALVWLLVLLVLVVAGAGILYLVPATGPGNPTAGVTLEESTPGFQDRATEAGLTFRTQFLAKEQGEKFKINLYDHGSGVAVGDYDGDGHDDIYFVNQLGPNALYRNKGDGTFVDVTKEAGVALGDRICTAATFADYDNDGRQDLFVTSTRGGNVLFRNLGNGKFKDVTKEAGLAHVGHSQTAVFFDFDNDGYLDLLVTNTGQWTTTFDQGDKYFTGKPDLFQVAASPKEFNILYHNNGNGTFTDVTEKSGLKGLGWAADIAVFDFDDDGFLDILITNMFGRSQLYHNNGDGTFTDVTLETLGRTPWGGMGAKAFDFNNDGKLDLYIVDMHSDMWTLAELDLSTVDEKRKYSYVTGPDIENNKPKARELESKLADLFQLRYGEVVFGNTLFKNFGKGKFEEISDRANMETLWPWGIATGDFDNDGYEDVFLPSGMGYPWGYWPSRLMMNNGNETFTERSASLGIEPPARGLYLEGTINGKKLPRSSRAAATADFDGDGRLEIVVNNFNDQPYFFKNNFPKKNYVALRLQGTKSNRDAIGAVVRLYAGQEIMTRQVHPAGGYLAQSSKTVHFGLGDRTKIDRIEIKWPRGTVQTIDNPAINKLHAVVEPVK
jgi:hypothetical protein